MTAEQVDYSYNNGFCKAVEQGAKTPLWLDDVYTWQKRDPEWRRGYTSGWFRRFGMDYRP